MNFKFSGLLVPLIFLIKLGNAQISETGSKDFELMVNRMRDEFRTLDELHVNMIIQVFENSSAPKPFYSQTADVKRSKSNYLYRLANHEMLMNDNFMVLVDHSSREILFSARDGDVLSGSTGHEFERGLDSLFHCYGNAVFVGKFGNSDRYRITRTEGEVQIVDLFIDPVNATLKRIDYTYRDNHFVKIELKVFDRKPRFEPMLFSEKNYVVKSKKQYAAAGRFQGFVVTSAIEDP